MGSLIGSNLIMSDYSQLKLSVLMPVYFGDTSSAFIRAFKSITIEQTRRPDEIVLVQDGVLGFNLSIADLNKYGVRINYIILEKNLGIVKALNVGLNAINGDIVVRMDSDDVAMPNRLELTERTFSSDSTIDLFCGSIVEFNADTGREIYRRVSNFPLSKYMLRNPFFHPAVAFRLSSVIKVGGYRDFNGFEDFDLWLRLYLANGNFVTTDVVVLRFTIDERFFLRRSGVKYLKREQNFLKIIDNQGLYEINYLSNLLIRYIIRLAPRALLKMIYIVRY